MLLQLTANAYFDFLQQFASLARDPVGYGVDVPRGGIYRDDVAIVLYPNAEVLHSAVADLKRHTLKTAGQMFSRDALAETARLSGDFPAAAQ